jgi:hypothetical protein
MNSNLPSNIDKELEFNYQFVVNSDATERTFVRKFIYLKIIDNELFIGHSIEGKIGLLTKINYVDLKLWLNYFDRI